MPYAIELFLDEHADRQVRQIWAALDEHGIPSLGSILNADYHPHVTFSVFRSFSLAGSKDVIRAAVKCGPLSESPEQTARSAPFSNTVVRPVRSQTKQSSWNSILGRQCRL
ncbi:hypothetical protein [Pseudofrankia sp. BMG5.36]|uniref:hypothetical protein n=1 Tax=Pseudofrankia sp. BMG5.36 TaxID=1834512 RepID=UPI0008DAF2C6|nr:hypothetical protein [Pseudofrankia sp. BMG5.36]OHV60608.1 hypothetical protein BCD48_05605 [Pseudofrankia sp. BMG5.36]